MSQSLYNNGKDREKLCYSGTNLNSMRAVTKCALCSREDQEFAFCSKTDTTELFLVAKMDTI